MDARPTIDEIGMGTKVLFPQGQYKGTPGKNERGIRWHEGVVEKVSQNIQDPIVRIRRSIGATFCACIVSVVWSEC
jgi:hypothetical protein